jgi:hypothetical protein
VVGVGGVSKAGGKAPNIRPTKPDIPAATGPKSVTVNPANPGKPRPSHYSAPAANGDNVSIPPQFGGPGPIQSVTGVQTAPLGVGEAQPAFHGGG